MAAALLLDTHVFLWWAARDEELREDAQAAIADPDSRVFVSAASAWEIAIKRTIGKLDVPDDLRDQLERHSFEPLSITIEHGMRAGSLPGHHRDPFDRILVAQAQIEGLTVVTRDSRIPRYEVVTLAA